MDIVSGINSICVTILVGLAVTIRTLAAVMAILLLFRALIENVSGGLAERGFLFRSTELFNAPVRSLLPVGLSRRGVDFSPLVTALVELFVGLGAGTFLDAVSDGLSMLY